MGRNTSPLSGFQIMLIQRVQDRPWLCEQTASQIRNDTENWTKVSILLNHSVTEVKASWKAVRDKYIFERMRIKKVKKPQRKTLEFLERMRFMDRYIRIQKPRIKKEIKDEDFDEELPAVAEMEVEQVVEVVTDVTPYSFLPQVINMHFEPFNHSVNSLFVPVSPSPKEH